MSLDGVPLKPARVEWQNREQLRFVLREGKKRQVRRMCELAGLYVAGLRRVRIGRVMLGELPVGQWRYLAPDETFSQSSTMSCPGNNSSVKPKRVKSRTRIG